MVPFEKIYAVYFRRFSIKYRIIIIYVNNTNFEGHTKIIGECFSILLFDEFYL